MDTMLVIMVCSSVVCVFAKLSYVSMSVRTQRPYVRLYVNKGKALLLTLTPLGATQILLHEVL